MYGMIQTTPLFVQDSLFQNYLVEINPDFSHPQLLNASRICHGLFSSLSHKSLSSIAESLIISRDQSSLNRFLTESDWGMELVQMDINRALIMQEYRQTAMTSKGVIVLDDTLLEKTGEKMDLVGEHFDHCSFRMKRGLSLVSINYCDETKNYNLFKEIYLRKKYLKNHDRQDEFKTKIELACDMLTRLIDTVPSVSERQPHIVFDSWFLAKDITSLLEESGFKYVSRAKNNRVIKGLAMNLKDYANTILKETDFTPYPAENGNGTEEAKLYYHTAILPISNLGDVKVVFIKQQKDQDVSCFLLSNNLHLSFTEVIELYSARWGIETDYKFTKQNLGLSEFHLRKEKGILRYLTLCFIASTFLEYYKLLGTFGRCFGKEANLSTKGREVRAYRHLMFERFLIWLDEQLSSGTDIFDLLSYFREESVRCPHGIQFVYHNTRLSLKCGMC
ncbi:MAG: transposase [Candidatus Lokiarchaeota archaeon]|nr:transposase [Candidatus Lokiarchaeota archaeon]MBD3255178.1 transposase [Candidatus Lokiarchaeota archaeon]